MGMGLSICRSIVEAHGGRIWVSRTAGPGVTVQFTLPVDESVQREAKLVGSRAS
jgi:signal transduction histidine kinase